MLRLLIEALFVGIGTLIFGTIVGYVLGKIMSVDVPEMCKQWNKNHIMELSLFLTGSLIHITFDLLGANKWYCKNGFACLK